MLTHDMFGIGVLESQYHMEKFTTFIVNMMKKEKLFASQGGPIILSQASFML